VLSSSGSRHFLRQMLEGTLPNLTVLAHNEIPAGIRVVSMGIVE
jgi:flagellar biosynthesis component FlhA